MTALKELLGSFRTAAVTEREKGTYFEELTRTYLRHEATYRDLYSDVWLYADWTKEQGIDGKDTGIDLVAKTNGTNEFHAIQSKFYAKDYRVQKSDIDSFFTASGKKPFTHRIIVTTTNNWSENAEDALQGQQPSVSKIDLFDLENSQIDWSKFQPNQEPVLKEKYGLRAHQKKALSEVKANLKNADRGKMIMACGTGKTFTSLRVAEDLAGSGKRVLFLVPSLALLSQTLTEWTQQSLIPLHSFAVCSDSDIGKKRKKDDDVVQTFMHELRYPATTNAKSLADEMAKRHDAAHMSVVFSTYHSIVVISEAQKKHGLGDFDLIICDEAHRTTGATFEGEEESKFVKIHDDNFIRGTKRIYMTATPRIYGDSAQATAEKDNVALCSMDDESLYGKDLHVITFSEAVESGLLVDYKVIVLTVDEAHISKRLQSLLADENNQLKVDDAAKIVGCWKALSKQDQEDGLADDSDPMQRAVAFCQVIEATTGKKIHKVSSKNIANMFQAVVQLYQEQEEDHNTLVCEAAHVDGSMNATEKEAKLHWLKQEAPKDTCRILSNVRCLSEGVDVPALDAILFLTPRNSQVDVVQSVGRIMRKAPNKTRGYVVLPVVIPTGMEPSKALNDNKIYKVVWEVLQALRSHDDRFDAMINKLDLIGKDNRKMEVIAITDKIQPKAKKSKGTKNKVAGKRSYSIGKKEAKYQPSQSELQFEVGEIERALYAKVVQKCGNRSHWEDWAKDIAKIAKTHITRITTIVTDSKNKKEVAAFQSFAKELRDDLNDSITDVEVIEMLAQHLITKPVFDALFKEYSFASQNPVSQAMQKVLDILQEHRLNKEADTLEKFYDSVQMRAEDINSAEGKQKIVVELYDKFFRNAFPRMTERLGIVYTPVEVVDFIIHSVNDVLQSEFGQTLGSKGVHIIDPFTGTGTFITRVLQSGLISKDQLPHKYKNEIHANEIILLAYYIAAINIEAVYHSLVGGDYQPFEGICLTDTFQLYEMDDMVSELMMDNSARRTRQKELDIRVIVGNPPYSEGQESGNDNAKNIEYANLDSSIRSKYGEKSSAGLQNSLFNSYIRAIRWASDRIGNQGVVSFVTAAGWLIGTSMDGLRQSLVEEYCNIYVFHLRGNARTSGELRRKEKDNIFKSGSRAPIAITLLVKNAESKGNGEIFFHDIGDYLTRDEKLEKIALFKSVTGITAVDAWKAIVPDKHNDWLNQRDDSFYDFMNIAQKGSQKNATIFSELSSGIKTNRDPWCYNASKRLVSANMKRMIAFYNAEVSRYHKQYGVTSNPPKPEDFVDKDSKKIKWTREIYNSLRASRSGVYDPSHVVLSAYRPFSKEWAYFDRHFNNCVYQMPKIFPYPSAKNLVIAVTGSGAGVAFSALMTDVLPNLHFQGTSQCLPLYLYEAVACDDTDLFSNSDERDCEEGFVRNDGISEEGLAYFHSVYPKEALSKEDIFYYIYGLLHSEEYRTRYADNLNKELPRIPCVSTAKDFWEFSKAGRKLSHLHVGYEIAALYPITIEGNPKSDSDYRVEKMKYAKSGKETDRTTVIYNSQITIKGIPREAQGYVISGKSALDWVIERQCVKPDKASGIVNDANLYATETVGNAKYPLELLQRVITVSLETMKIINALPPLDIDVSSQRAHE